jgi:hypothetical protein
MKLRWSTARAVLLAVLGAELLAACTSNPWYEHGLEWVVWAEEERARLDKAGFPQYSGGGVR